MNKFLLVLLGCLLLSVTRLSAQTCLTSNLAAGKTVKASTLQTDAHNVTDGNLTTEWQPTVGGAQWIYVDLGQSYTVCKVILKWTTWASDDHWSIYLTNDTTSWGTSINTNPGTPTTQAAGDAYSYHTVDLSGSSASGRYLRISFSNMTAWNARLDEIEVYNKVPLVLPSVSLTAPLDGANYTEGDSITFTATATEAGGTISKVEFFQGSTKIGEDASSPYSFTWTHVPEGEYLITAKATDANLGSSASTAINVFVDYPDPAWSRTGNAGTTDSNFLGTTDSTKLIFRTRNVKRMTILPNGNIGIGVDTPTAALHVKGVLKLADYKNDTIGSSVLSTDSTGKVILKKLPFGYSNTIDASQYPDSTFKLNFTDGPPNSNTPAIIQYSKQRLFSVMERHQDSYAEVEIGAREGFALGQFAYGPSAGIYGYGRGDEGGSGVHLFAFDTTQGATMDLYGSGLDIDANNIEFYQFPNDPAESSVLTTDAIGRMKLKPISAFSVSSNWKLSGTTAFDTVNSVGIGTSNTQGYKLAVNGNAIFTKIKVKLQTAWPDYVFERTYHLPDLSDLETYIVAHKHLPGILSAAEVSKNDGLDIGQHQAALLQKIEELTLYLIEDHKKQQVQENQLQAQQKELDILRKLPPITDTQQKELEVLKAQNKKLEQQNAQLSGLQQQIDELKKLIQPKN